MVTSEEKQEIIACYEAQKAREYALVLKARREKRHEKEKAIHEDFIEYMTNDYFCQSKEFVYIEKQNEWRTIIKSILKSNYKNIAEIMFAMENAGNEKTRQFVFESEQAERRRYEDSYKKRRTPLGGGVKILDCIIPFHKNGKEFYEYYQSKPNSLTKEQKECYEHTICENEKFRSKIELEK